MITTRCFALTAALAALPTLTSAAQAQPQPEWTLTTSNVVMSPVRFADVDGDGTQDIVLATMGPLSNPYSASFIYVLNMDGSSLPGWPVQLGNLQPITGAAVAVGDIDDDGDRELVAQGWYYLHVWNHDGTTYPGWPHPTGTTSSASPALADLDHDGDLEIIVPTGSTMHVWHHDGSEAAGWPNAAAENFHAASVADVDGDGELEIVAGTWRPQFPDTVPFELYMWHANGDLAPGFPIGKLGSVRGPVSLGDVDADGEVEIIVRAGDTLHVFNAQGEIEPGWPVNPGAIRNATPSLGDLDGDGDREIVIGGFDIHAYHHDGTTVAGWPADLGPTGNINSGVILASIDDDPGTVEVIAKFENAIAALDAGGTMLDGFPYPLSDDNHSATFSPTPAVGDLDGDGDVEYAFVSVSGTLVFFDEQQPHGNHAAFWPMFQHDVRNTSFLPSCPADLNGDGIVGPPDLAILLTNWGPCPPPPPCPADLNGDGAVGPADLAIMLTNWGKCP